MNRRSGLAIGVTAAIAAGIGAALWLHEEPIELRAGTALPDRRPVADFALIDQQGRVLDARAFEGHWSLVFTGFTNCPDICPTTLATMTAIGRRLGAAAPQLVFVSVDPDRDTPERLAAYLAHFGPGFLGATGSREQVGIFTRSLGLAQVRNPGVGGEYTVDHSTALVLIDPQVRVAGYFQPPHDDETIAADLAAIAGDG